MNIEQCINDKTHILCILQIHKIILNRYTMPLASNLCHNVSKISLSFKWLYI
jgi:hypothetical protein